MVREEACNGPSDYGERQKLFLKGAGDWGVGGSSALKRGAIFPWPFKCGTFCSLYFFLYLYSALWEICIICMECVVAQLS